MIITSHTAWGDVLHLENGDRLTGRITGIADGHVTLETTYAGELSIPQEAVRNIEVEQPLAVQYPDGRQELLDAPGPLPGGVVAAAPTLEALQAKAEAVEVEEEPETPRRWSGSLESGLTMRRGNTDTLDVTLGATAVRAGEGHTLTLNALAAYGEADRIINTRQYKLDGQWKVYPSERFYYYLLAGAERSDGRKLDLRLNTAVGLGRDFIKAERQQLSADLGVDFALERWAPFTPAERGRIREARRAEARENLQGLAAGLLGGATPLTLPLLREAGAQWRLLQNPLFEDTRKEEYLSLRVSTEYARTVFEQSRLSTKLAGFANLDDFGEYRVTNDLGFTTPLTQALRLRVSLKSEYDSLAGDSGIDPWDHMLITGLRYEF